MVTPRPAQTQSVPAEALDPSTITGAFALLVAAYLVVRISTYLVSKVAERTVEHRIAVKMFLPVFKTAVYSATLFYIVGGLFQLNQGQVLAISGLFGAAIGFGIKDLFSSLVGGLIIILERPYKIGDKIQFGHSGEFGDHYGEVIDIGIRSTRLQTPDDTEIIVPNDAVFKSSIANTNAGHPEMLVVVEFTVDAEAPVDQAKRLVREALITSRYVYIADDRPVVVLEGDDPYYRTIRGKAYVNDPRNEFLFTSDVTGRVRQAFDDAGIDKPSPLGDGFREDS